MMANGNLARHDVRQRIDEQGRAGVVVAFGNSGQIVGIVLDARASVREDDCIDLLILQEEFRRNKLRSLRKLQRSKA